jgi:hypothetical protein
MWWNTWHVKSGKMVVTPTNETPLTVAMTATP